MNKKSGWRRFLVQSSSPKPAAGKISLNLHVNINDRRNGSFFAMHVCFWLQASEKFLVTAAFGSSACPAFIVCSAAIIHSIDWGAWPAASGTAPSVSGKKARNLFSSTH
ncbi:hypothetical protein ACFRCQ_09615 [Cytobacillus firmus]|uniref:hypothetical protein n=1 Tax=Cytobacillus firmus TaxID=1399 RepID=UPI003682D97E